MLKESSVLFGRGSRRGLWMAILNTLFFEAIASLVVQLSDYPVCAELSKQLASPASTEVATKATFDRSGCRQPEPLGVQRVH